MHRTVVRPSLSRICYHLQYTLHCLSLLDTLDGRLSVYIDFIKSYVEDDQTSVEVERLTGRAYICLGPGLEGKNQHGLQYYGETPISILCYEVFFF